MALIKCPECGKDVSDQTKACIHCGYPLNKATRPAVETTSQNDMEKYAILGDDLRLAEKYPEALANYMKAAECGNAHAQMWIGNFYSRGLGVEINQTEAAMWYQKAADNGSKDALNNLALLYKNGNGIEKDIDKAIDLFLQAIQQGSAVAASNLGSLYEFATDDHQSYQLARKYYERAIELGTTEYATYSNLALIYSEGKKTNVDYGKAEQYFLKAIQLGSVKAKENYAIFANNRGVAYADGKGVATDYVKAEAYYRKAIEYGNQQAKINYEALKKKMASPKPTASTPAPQSSKTNSKVIAIIIVAAVILLCWLVGSTSIGDREKNSRTCSWCNGTGYSANGAQNPEDYVFTKTPCKKCGGDGKY